MFVYANYLKPGIHKFLIYDPVNKRAFVKTILVDLNTSDFYPEYPTKIKAPRKKLILNVWRQAKKETRQTLNSMCTNDIEQPGFNLSLVIRDPEEL
jgi:murein L,D-transpeptidase YafK